MVELHPSLASGRSRRSRRLRLLGVEHIEDPLGRRDAGLQDVGHRSHLRQRLGELPGVLDERLHLTQAGRIVEQGNHAELLAARGAYFDLYNSQFAAALADEENVA